MVSKFLEKKVEVILDENSQTPVNSLELEYYLLESVYTEDEKEQNVPGEPKEQKAYGIEIVEKYQGVLNERRQFKNIFSSMEKTRSLVDVLAANTVTPTTLPYILDDLLGQ